MFIANHYVLCPCVSVEMLCLLVFVYKYVCAMSHKECGWLRGLFSVGLYSGARHIIQRMGRQAATHFIWHCTTHTHTRTRTHTLACINKKSTAHLHRGAQLNTQRQTWNLSSANKLMTRRRQMDSLRRDELRIQLN